jgi:hypothetical protein
MTTPGRPGDAPPDPGVPTGGAEPDAVRRPPRPMIERIGLALVATFVIAVFGALGAASFASGDLFLAVMAAIGALMTAWAGGRTLIRG